MVRHVVPLIEPGDVSGVDRARFDKVAATRGSVPNVFKSLANSPQTMELVGELGAHLRFGTSLPDALREAVVLTIARATGCAYEWTHHWHVAERLGIDADLIGSIADGRGAELDGPVGAAVRLAQRVVGNEPPADTDVRSLQLDLGNSGLVDLLVLIGHYRLLAGVIDVLRVPLEPGLDSVPFTGSGRS